MAREMKLVLKEAQKSHRLSAAFLRLSEEK